MLFLQLANHVIEKHIHPSFVFSNYITPQRLHKVQIRQKMTIFLRRHDIPTFPALPVDAPLGLCYPVFNRKCSATMHCRMDGI